MDIGTGSTKAVLLEDGKKIIDKKLVSVKGRPEDISTNLFNEILESNNLNKGDIEYIASTGYGRYQMVERNIQISDLTTTAKGAFYVYKSYKPHLILDIGTQSTRALRINEKGKIIQFKMNERCAAGSGRFIERCSKYLTIPMDQVSDIALKADKPQSISSVCAVLSETEIINHVSQGVSVENIFMGVLLSIADRASTLLKRLKLDSDVFIAGGLVHLPAMQKALKEVLPFDVHFDPLAQYSAAIGAGILGHQRAQKILSVTI